MELGSPLPARPSLAPLPHAQALTSFMVSMEAKYLDHQSSMLSSGSSSSGSSELPFFFFFFLSFSSSAWRVGQVQSPAYVPVPWPLLEPWAISETPSLLTICFWEPLGSRRFCGATKANGESFVLWKWVPWPREGHDLPT